MNTAGRDTGKTPEKVVLAGLLTNETDPVLFEEDMHEMERLCETAGANVTAIFRQKRTRAATGTYLGYGKLIEIQSAMNESGATTLIIDAPLAPGQIKAMESIVQNKVVDRGQLILDIFALRAKTAEAKLQVELAQMRMMYPRLTHAWSHFSRQLGGIGTRGPGEKQLEVDRRIVLDRIGDLKKKLMHIEKVHAARRSGRTSVFKVALAGYTNVGKSSLLNALCGSSVVVENKLFATLDTTTRRLFIPEFGTIILSDTVGLLRKLPHHLVASFRSTLREMGEADLLLIVIDASCNWIEQQIVTTEQVLNDLGADKIPRLLLLNKIDLVTDPFIKKQLSIDFPNSIMMSSLNTNDLKVLKQNIAEMANRISAERVTGLLSTAASIGNHNESAGVKHSLPKHIPCSPFIE